ncbi:MAG: [FeFe] hydrogenase H-cluster maturation GTPase HydF [Peptococcaceae bacterium]|nr:[FeFe] hydrogenase H-cluster maturation GTPase HydF [Peptococcaceae bacterium]
MQDTPKGSRLHIALLGRRNAGKSSLINALTNQEIALVSSVPGTTTDPVYKAMEILPLGPVMLIDTAGLDDEGALGNLRVKKSLEVLEKTDVALLVTDSSTGFGEYEQKIFLLCAEKNIPVIIVLNKADLLDDYHRNLRISEVNFYLKRIGNPPRPEEKTSVVSEDNSPILVGNSPVLMVSSVTKEGILSLKQHLSKVKPTEWLAPAIVGDILSPGDMVILVVPIDMAAPQGRLILPQVQTIRDILDHDCLTVVCKEYELKKALDSLKEQPKLVITDSQVFMKVSADLPPDVPLTSFSILMARYKGDLLSLARGAKTIEDLVPGDKILIAEACTHHQQPDDIGKVKIPRWLRQMVGGELKIDFANGSNYPANLDEYKLIVHCGGCMLNRKEMLHRINLAENKGIPIVNYGILIAAVHGILPRALKPLGIEYNQL